MASRCGIDNKSKHHRNQLTWLMFLTKIHSQKVIIAISFRSSLLQKLCQILHFPLKSKIFNFQGSGIGCNSFLIPKNIIFSKGPNMASQRFHICGHDQPLHQVNSNISSYFQFSSFNVDSNLLLLYHMQGSKAFLIHHVKLSSLTSKKYIPTFSLQRLVHLLPHIPCQHSCHLSQTKMVPIYNLKNYVFFSFEQKNKLQKQWNFWKK